MILCEFLTSDPSIQGHTLYHSPKLIHHMTLCLGVTYIGIYILSRQCVTSKNDYSSWLSICVISLELTEKAETV